MFQPLNLDGQAAEITFRNFGRRLDAPEGRITLTLSGGASKTVIIDPQGNINAEATPEEAAALAAAVERTEQPGGGFAVDYLADGTVVAIYDGTCGVRCPTALDGETPAVATSDRLDFETVLEGQ